MHIQAGKTVRLGSVHAAWYQREISIPGRWAGRRIALSADCLNSLATVYVDGAKAGEIRFPGGELDLTQFCRPAESIAQPACRRPAAQGRFALLQGYGDGATSQIHGTEARALGDLYLISTPVPRPNRRRQG